MNKSEDVFFKERAALVKESFNNKLLDCNTGIYLDGEESTHSSLHANVFPLAFGMVPEKNITKVVEFIKSRGIACSPYGANYLPHSLCNMYEANYAYELLSSREERSWGYWIYELESTMTLEAWDIKYKTNLNWNHPWGSAPVSIISPWLMGIEPLEPGYRKVRIKPQPATLENAEIKFPTTRCDIKISFSNELNKPFVLHVTIPANMEAEIYLPVKNPNQKNTQNGKPVNCRIDGSFAVVGNVDSGTNTYQVSLY